MKINKYGKYDSYIIIILDMDNIYHRKVMEKLDVIESKLNYTNEVYSKGYVLVNTNFTCEMFFLLWIILFFVCLYFKLI